MSPRAEAAPPVLTPRWFCTFGTFVAVIAATSADDARAIIAWRLHERLVPIDHAREINVRPLRVDDEANLGVIEDGLARIGGKANRW